MPRKRNEKLYLDDMGDAIDRILEYTSGGRETFMDDSMVQDAVVRNLEILGEAVRGVTEATREAHPEIPWKKIAGTRDRVIHGYFRVDLDIVWEIVEKELPLLRDKIASLPSM
jgi:uncharacterized protein with HEPN domain